MFKDLKEYQEITQLYHDSVNISEEQREINKIFIEEGFTLEEIEYLEENFDELWENELEGLTEHYVVESFREENLTEEQINEILGIKTGIKLAGKLIKKAAPVVKKGLKSAKTAIGDTVRGGISKAKDVAKSAKDKVGKVLKKAAPVLKRIPGIALPVAAVGGAVSGINALRKRGKKERENKSNTDSKGKVIPSTAAIRAANQGRVGGGNAGASTDSGGTQGKGGAKAGEAGAQVLKNKTTQTKTETKPKKMHPIEKKNRARFGDEKVDKLKAKQVDFKAMKKGNMSKDDFIKKYPNSITAQKSKGLRDHAEWDAYDMVLEYLFSTEQVASLEEANYVMMEMDQQTIGGIVKEVKDYLQESPKLKAAGALIGGLASKAVGSGGKAASMGGTAAGPRTKKPKPSPGADGPRTKRPNPRSGAAGGPKLEEGLGKAAMKLGALVGVGYGVKKGAEKLGTMSGTPKKPKKKKDGLIQKLKDRRDATNKAIEQM